MLAAVRGLVIFRDVSQLPWPLTPRAFKSSPRHSRARHSRARHSTSMRAPIAAHCRSHAETAAFERRAAPAVLRAAQDKTGADPNRVGGPVNHLLGETLSTVIGATAAGDNAASTNLRRMAARWAHVCASMQTSVVSDKRLETASSSFVHPDQCCLVQCSRLVRLVRRPGRCSLGVVAVVCDERMIP